MPINTMELLRAAEVVAEDSNLKVTVKYSMAAAGLTGATTLVGGLLLGPIGFLIGGTVGGAGSFLATDGKFRSALAIIKGLNRSQQQRLIAHLNAALKDFDVTDLVALSLLVMREGGLYVAVLDGIKTFLTNDMKLEIYN